MKEAGQSDWLETENTTKIYKKKKQNIKHNNINNNNNGWENGRNPT